MEGFQFLGVGGNRGARRKPTNVVMMTNIHKAQGGHLYSEVDIMLEYDL